MTERGDVARMRKGVPPRVALPPQQERVAICYCDGFSAAEIGDALGLREGTVRDYIKLAKQKYCLAGRAAATKVELRRRLIEDGYILE